MDLSIAVLVDRFFNDEVFQAAVLGIMTVLIALVGGIWALLTVVVPALRKEKQPPTSAKLEISLPSVEAIEEKLDKLLKDINVESEDKIREEDQLTFENRPDVNTKSAAQVIHEISRLRHLFFQSSVSHDVLPDGIELICRKSNQRNLTIIKQERKSIFTLIEIYKDYLALNPDDTPFVSKHAANIASILGVSVMCMFISMYISIVFLVGFFDTLNQTGVWYVLFPLILASAMTVAVFYIRFCYTKYLALDLENQEVYVGRFWTNQDARFQSAYDIQPYCQIGGRRYEGISINGKRVFKGRGCYEENEPSKFRQLSDRLRTAFGMPVELAPGIFVVPPQTRMKSAFG